MQFVTILEQVGREGMAIGGTPMKKPYFSPGFILFPSSAAFRLPIGVAPHVHKWGVAAIVLHNTALSTAIFSLQPGSRAYMGSAQLQQARRELYKNLTVLKLRGN